MPHAGQKFYQKCLGLERTAIVAIVATDTSVTASIISILLSSSVLCFVLLFPFKIYHQQRGLQMIATAVTTAVAMIAVVSTTVIFIYLFHFLFVFLFSGVYLLLTS